MNPKTATRKLESENSEVLDTMRERWLSNVVHDISTPLFVARGYLRLMTEEHAGALTEDHKRYLAAVRDNLVKLVALTQELNDYQVTRDFELVSFSTRELLEEVAGVVRRVLVGKIVTLAQNFSNLTATTIGDREKLHQALEGFISGAAEVIGCHGSIELLGGEHNDAITLQVTATPASQIADNDNLPDLSTPSMLWRLHGGSIIAHVSDGCYSLVCELPILRMRKG